MLKNQLVGLFSNRGNFLDTCSHWKDYPAIPAVYILTIDRPFELNGKPTDILNIGQTRHFGAIQGNSRLWDYYTKCSEKEKEIVEEIRKMEDSGVVVEIWWTYKWSEEFRFS